jgi:hypothetical protein
MTHSPRTFSYLEDVVLRSEHMQLVAEPDRTGTNGDNWNM